MIFTEQDHRTAAAVPQAGDTSGADAANGFGTPFNITLSGGLTGSGGFAKTGAGTLTVLTANPTTLSSQVVNAWAVARQPPLVCSSPSQSPQCAPDVVPARSRRCSGSGGRDQAPAQRG